MGGQQHDEVNVADSVEVTDFQQVAVAKARTVVLRGFLEAVARLRTALEQPEDGDAVYIALAEAMNWLASLADEDARLQADDDAQAVLFGRHRTHHQHGSIAYPDEAKCFRWRPASQLPRPGDKRHRHRRRHELYVKHLEGQPVEAVFERLTAKLTGRTPDGG
jgi:hypothetical protein